LPLYRGAQRGLGNRRVFINPVKPGAGEELHAAALDPGIHAVAVELDLAGLRSSPRLPLFPTHSCGSASNLSPLFRAEFPRPSLSASCSQLGSGALRAIGVEFLVFLAGRDPHHLDGVADHVGGALLTSGSARHHPSIHE
jgi:hypothetical protein